MRHRRGRALRRRYGWSYASKLAGERLRKAEKARRDAEDVAVSKGAASTLRGILSRLVGKGAGR